MGKRHHAAPGDLPSIAAELFTYLSTNTTFASVLGTGSACRLWPVKLPQEPQLPAITYSRVSAPRTWTHDSDTNLPWTSPRWQFTCWATTYDGVISAAWAVNEALGGFKGTFSATSPIITAKVVNELDDRETTTGYFRRYVDVVLEYQEA